MSLWNSFHGLFGPPASKSKSRGKSRRPNRRATGFQPHIESLECRALLSAVTGDFNGDGVADLAIGLTNQTVGSASNAGAVQILYGARPVGTTKIGLTAAKNQFITKATLHLTAASNENFGSALAAGDFNGDGIADLAVGVSGQTISGKSGAGAVYILFGSKTGLKITGQQLWTQDSASIVGVAAAGDHFGSALAAGDFNGDHRIDLAIGSPNEDVGVNSDAGAVNVIYGKIGGLKALGNQLINQSLAGIVGGVGANNHYGGALAMGDFNADGFQDLAIGAPGQTVDGIAAAGAVNVLYGAKTGLQITKNQFWTPNTQGMQGLITTNGQFGFALAAGDFNGDSRAELAIGAPGEDIDSVNGAGAVHVLFGSSARLTIDNNQVWNEDSTGATSGANADDRFGEVLAVGQFNTDHVADLAIGIPNETVNFNNQAFLNAGAVRVLYGVRSSGLGTTNTQLWSRASAGIVPPPTANDHYGKTLAAGDFSGDKISDIAIGVPQNDLTAADAGDTQVIFGTPTGLNPGFSDVKGSQVRELWLAKNQQDGEAFLATNKTKPGVVTLADGLQYKITTPASAGPTPQPFNSVSVNYTGKFIDGTVFDSSKSGPATFAMSGVIKGFSEAIALMHVGEKLTAYIPSYLAYGMVGSTSGGIAPNSTLVFDIELVAIS